LDAVSPPGVWWRHGVIYQVYPRSFQDANDDGQGDLAGITARLGYFVELGVDIIWLSPIFPSPMRDAGYDIANYVDIDPLFGTLSDFDKLLKEAHDQNIKVLLDLVPNHTSDQHPWFVNSRSSRRSEKRDWYLWADAAPGGGPPNNWLSEFGGSAWEYDAETDQYYYHAFLAAQPDLNWRNPQVRRAMADIVRFWLQRGVDGFRVDVLWHLLKDKQLRDNPPNPRFKDGDPPYRRLLPQNTTDLPEVHDVVSMLRRVIDEFPDRLMIGEVYLPIKQLVAYYGRDLRGAHLPFNFALLETPWEATALARLIEDYEAALPEGGWPNWVLGNHDRPRLVSRIGTEQTRLAAMLLLTLRGTPTIYYGEEIGMREAVIPPDRLRDPIGDSIAGLRHGRDSVRTPMQWDASRFAGFSSVDPWLPIADTTAGANVAAQREYPSSILNLYRRLIAIRRASPALLDGAYRTVMVRSNLFVFARIEMREQMLIALNLGGDAVVVDPGTNVWKGTIAASTVADRDGEVVGGSIMLRAHEGVVVRLDSESKLQSTLDPTDRQPSRHRE
jgi:alpha-glucosidase